MTSVSTPDAMAPAPPPPAPGRSLRIGRRSYPVLLPNIRDPRMHLAATIISLQVLGQTVLDFELSIAQILVSLVTAGLIEFGITFKRQRTIAWPASAMLTGNGVAFILRVPGTHHGDWWSLNGWYLFAGVSAVSVLSKYIIRYKGSHIFNPSNFGLVLGFLVLGSNRVEPLDFWWGPMSPAVAAAIIVIAIGALVILRRLHFMQMALAFWVVFAISLAVVAAAGHCMTARWRFGPICGASFWWVLVTSPEILVFMCFMITDPKTTPKGNVARLVFGVAVAFEAALFVSWQQTEFSTKVAVLSSLLVICAVRPYFEKFFPAPGSERDHLRVWLASLGGRKSPTAPMPPWSTVLVRSTAAVALIAVCGASLVLSGIPAREPLENDFRVADAVVARPEVPPSPMPPVAIDPSVRRIDADITQARADQMARDAIADLQIEADARKQGDRDLAMTAAGGARLNSIWKDIDEGRKRGQITASTHQIDDLTLKLVYDTVNAQAGPQYGLTVRGTETRTTYEGSTAPRVVSEEQKPFERTFALLYRQGHFLIAADLPPS